jgi:hypothetical protein
MKYHKNFGEMREKAILACIIDTEKVIMACLIDMEESYWVRLWNCVFIQQNFFGIERFHDERTTIYLNDSCLVHEFTKGSYRQLFFLTTPEMKCFMLLGPTHQ